MEVSDKVKKTIEDDESKDADESLEKFSEAFVCCICLDLLYKPIVLACGHISCFWCVHKSMNSLHESHCPICRHPYRHFPIICHKLHFLLLKMYPVAYKRREIQILEFEKEKGWFSPVFDGPVQELYIVDSSQESSILEHDLPSYPSSSRKNEMLCNLGRLESSPIMEENGRSNLQIPIQDSQATSMFVDQEKQLQQRTMDGTCLQISVDDALCTLCKQLLFRPVVLNCGHVYCESCILLPTNETLLCQVCQSAHPGGLPKVCLQFNDFLQEQFPIQYSQRRSSVQLKQVHLQQESRTTCSSEAAKESFHLSPSSTENLLSWWGDHKVHIGAGCDSCGMYPIIGNRYRCKDCTEVQGYDLCGDCYNTGSKLPGRFNQQHTPDHKFEIFRPNCIRNIMLRLLRGQLQDVSAAPIPSRDTSETPEIVFSSLSGDTQEIAESGLVNANETEEDQGNH